MLSWQRRGTGTSAYLICTEWSVFISSWFRFTLISLQGEYVDCTLNTILQILALYHTCLNKYLKELERWLSGQVFTAMQRAGVWVPVSIWGDSKQPLTSALGTLIPLVPLAPTFADTPPRDRHRTPHHTDTHRHRHRHIQTSPTDMHKHPPHRHT